jgi:hypothetical protein
MNGTKRVQRWLEIRHSVHSCYAQWEDVGPFNSDSAGYVFGDQRPFPNANHGAGIDVSPAVRDYLGAGSQGLVDWRFVEEVEVPARPWSVPSRLQRVQPRFGDVDLRSRNLGPIEY